MASTMRSPSSGGSLTSLDPSPPPSASGAAPPISKAASSSKPPARSATSNRKATGSDASSDLSELSSDPQGSDGDNEPSDILSPDDNGDEEDDDEEDEGDDSSTDQPFMPSSPKRSVRKPKKKKPDAKAPSSTSRKPKASSSHSKSQSPAKSSKSAKAKQSMSYNAYRHPRQKSDSSSPSNLTGGPSNHSVPPLSSTSSYGSGAVLAADDSGDEDDGFKRSSRRSKRSALVPGGMWDWVPRKPKPKKDAASKRTGGAESGHESASAAAADRLSPSRESEVDAKPNDGLADGSAPILASAPPDDEEDVKPDISTLISRTIGNEQDSSVIPSTRTSPGLPLAAIHNGTRHSTNPPTNPSSRQRSISRVSAVPEPKENPDDEADAMELDIPVAANVPPATPDTGLDILAQFAASLGGDRTDRPESPGPNDTDMNGLPPSELPTGDAVPSEAGDDPEDGDEGEDSPSAGKDQEEGSAHDAGDDVSDNDAPPRRARRRNENDQEGTSPDSKIKLLPDDEGDDPEPPQDDDKDGDSDQESTADDPPVNLLPLEGEGVEAEQEQETENEIQPMQRVEALEILAAMELKFALLRERIYQDKMRDISREEKLLFEGNHPEYMYLLSELQRRKDRKLDLASRRLDREKEFASHKRKMEERAAWASWTEAKSDVRDQLVGETNAKRRKLEREKRKLDLPLASRDPPTLPPHRALSPPSPRSIKRTIQQHTSRYSSLPSLHQPQSAPSLVTLTQNELAMDLELLTGRSRRQASQTSHSHPPRVQQQQPVQQQPLPAPGMHPQYAYGSPGPVYNSQPHPSSAPRYGPPPGYGHPDPAGMYVQHPPPTYDPAYDPYGAPMQHYPPSGPPAQPQYAVPAPYAYQPLPPPPQQALHQPQPQYHAYRPNSPPPPANGRAYSRNAWRASGGGAEPLENGTRDKVVIDLTRMSPEGMPPQENGVLPPPSRSGGPTPRPSSSHIKQEPRDERPSSSAGRMGERLPPLANQVPSPVLQYSTSTTPRPSSTLPPLSGITSPFPAPVPRAPHLPALASPPAAYSNSGLPPRSSATPISAIIHRHSQSPTVPKRSATPLGLPPFGPAPPPQPVPNGAGDRAM